MALSRTMARTKAKRLQLAQSKLAIFNEEINRIRAVMAGERKQLRDLLNSAESFKNTIALLEDPANEWMFKPLPPVVLHTRRKPK